MKNITIEEMRTTIAAHDAYIAGKNIQIELCMGDGSWVTAYHPNFNCSTMKYRIQQKATYRPYTFDEVVPLIGCPIIKKDNGFITMLSAADPETKKLWIGGCTGHTLETLFNKYQHIKGEPCGKLEG